PRSRDCTRRAAPPPYNRRVERRASCRWCKEAVSGRRRTFCSDACVHEWRLRSSTSYLRECVFERDRGICAVCRIDTIALRGRKSWWEADHILPVVEGGDSNLENIRTLCVMCHRTATAELRARRAGVPPAVAQASRLRGE